MRLFKSLLLLLFISTLFSCDNAKEQTTIYLVRHAEKDTTVDQYNPPLIEAGFQRAEKLKEELSDYDIQYIFSTKFQRNMSTVKPLANFTDKEVHQYEYHKWQNMLDSLKTIPGVHLICGHGDNLLPMINYLGADIGKKKLGHNEYDNLFKVTIEEEKVSGEVLKF